MRNAPSVSFPVGRCVFYGSFLLALSALGLVALAGVTLMPHWERAAPLDSSVWIVGGLLWLVWTSLAWWHWQASPVGRLRWDAQAAGPDSQPGAWRWLPVGVHTPFCVNRVECVWDGQSRCWLHLHGVGRFGQWMWVERRQDIVRWEELRRALVAAR